MGAMSARAGIDHETAQFEARLRRWWPDVVSGLRDVYARDTADAAAAALEDVARAAHAARSPELRALDYERLLRPDRLASEAMVGYAAYADRFAGSLAGVAQRLDYLRELGVTYLHLMPLLRPREGDNDGGYAVADYTQVRADLGSMDDLRALTGALRSRGISLVLDLVLNHVAREHEWAVRARAGQERYRAYFHIFGDREVPDAYERTLPEVFPQFAPGNFSWDDDLHAWVWTTFNSFQGTSTGPTRTCWSSSRASSSTWPTPGSRCCASTRSPSCGSGWARTARVSPRFTR